MKENRLLGCRHWFEAYLQKSTLDGEAWDNTLHSILRHIGVMRNLKIIFHVEGNLVHYYFGANKDLTGLSNSLERVSLRRVSADSIKLPAKVKNEWLVSFVTNGNLLDLRERAQVNRNKTLEYAVFSLRGITPQTVHASVDLVFKNANGIFTGSHKNLFALPGRLIAVNFRENERYAYKKFSKHLDIQKSLHILKNTNDDALVEVETYPYLPQNGFLDLTRYDFDKHSFIVGASGSGKSKFIGLFVDRLLRSQMAANYRVVVIDPHASLEEDLGNMQGSEVINFKSHEDSTELFAENGTDVAASTELTLSLLKSLLGGNYSVRVERLIRYSLTVLLTAQVMSFDSLRKLISNEQYREQILKHVESYIPENVTEYFKKELPEILSGSKHDVVVPIIELIDEIQLGASGSTSQQQAQSLAKVVERNRLTVFSLNKVGMGEKALKTVSGLLIQQLFLLAQSRQFNEKIILIIDEVSIIQNPTISQILAEARKYNLFVFLSQQYFGQVDQSLQDAIYSNVSNYYVFKVSETDARSLEGNITMELPRKMTMEATRVVTMEQDLRVPILTSLDPRECVVRVSSGGKTLPAFKARTLDFEPTRSTINVEKKQKLETYERSAMPEKFIENSVDKAGQSDDQVKPDGGMPTQTINLMEVLASKSSKRNERKAGE